MFSLFSRMCFTLKDIILFGDIKVVLKANGKDVDHLLFSDKRTQKSKENFYYELSSFIMEYLINELQTEYRCPAEMIVRAALSLHVDMFN